MFTLSGDNADTKTVSTVSVNIMKNKNKIERDYHLSHTFEQLRDKIIFVTLTTGLRQNQPSFLSSSDFVLYLDNYLNSE